MLYSVIFFGIVALCNVNKNMQEESDNNIIAFHE